MTSTLTRAALLAALALALIPMPASASYRTLHSFCVKPDCVDGTRPGGALAMDTAGDLFGTTNIGGKHGAGTVFELTPNLNGTFRYRVIYSFCARNLCPDGENPFGGVIVDTNGDVYGTASGGGSADRGTVFELTPDGTGWQYHVIYNFCVVNQCKDGAQPIAGLAYKGQSAGQLYDGTSTLYGTTEAGSPKNQGVAYKLHSVVGQQIWNETTLYAFCQQTDCADGGSPVAPVAVDASGNVFGVTSQGGSGSGVAFEISGGQEILLHTFCSLSDCADGSFPSGATLDPDGNLVGATTFGGEFASGTVFKIVPSGANSPETVLHSFCRKSNCPDGAQPMAGVTVDGSGNIFGTAIQGGTQGVGSIFRIDTGGAFKVLHNFCFGTGCTDGRQPQAPLFIDALGDVFGIAFEGGASNDGTVFKLVP